MGKQNSQFKLKDYYAIKHALQKQLDEKIWYVDTMNNMGVDNEKVQQLKKDVQHEEHLLDYICDEIDIFKSRCHIK